MNRRAAGVTCAGVIGWLVGGPVVAVALAAPVVAAPRIRRRRRATRDRRQLGTDFATLLEVAARAVRTGSSVLDALEDASRRHPGMAAHRLDALTRRRRDARGRVAVADWEVDSDDPVVGIVAAVVAMSTGAVGGSARALEAGASLLRERERTRHEVVTGASHARASTLLMLAMPLLVGAGSFVVLPGAVAGIANRPIVIAALLVGVALNGFGAWWSTRMVDAVCAGAR